MKPIRILHIVSCLDKTSGIMSIVMNWYKNINREKIQFDFLYCDRRVDTYQNDIESLGGKIFYIPRLGITNYFSFKNQFENFLALNSRVYKVIHLHEILLGFVCLPLAKSYGIDHLIVHSHSTKYSSTFLKSVRNRLLCFNLKKNATIYFACSREAGIFLFGKKDVINGKVLIVNNAIDCEKYRYNLSTRNRIKESLKLENDFVVGHVGRFSFEKNHSFLVDIFENVKEINPDAKLLLVGDGPLKDCVLKKVEQKGLADSVIFYGKSDHVNELLQVMDVFVLPSFFEGLALVLVEAQAAGLPCVATSSLSEDAKLVDDLYQKCSLGSSPKQWANTIIECGKKDKRDTYLEMQKEDMI